MLYDILTQRARYFKENPKGVSEMCKAMEDLRNEALERGRKEGHILTMIDNRYSNLVQSQSYESITLYVHKLKTAK